MCPLFRGSVISIERFCHSTHTHTILSDSFKFSSKTQQALHVYLYNIVACVELAASGWRWMADMLDYVSSYLGDELLLVLSVDWFVVRERGHEGRRTTRHRPQSS